MTVREMLKRTSSQEITDWAAIFSIEDEDIEKKNKNKGSGDDNEDITDDLIASIEADQAGESI